MADSPLCKSHASATVATPVGGAVSDASSGFAGHASSDPFSSGCTAVKDKPIADRLKEKFPDCDMWIDEKSSGVLELSKIVVPEKRRNEGLGTQFMNELCQHADAEGRTVALSPSSDYGGSKTRLQKFYKQFGFVPNKGRNKDFGTKESMVRQPQ